MWLFNRKKDYAEQPKKKITSSRRRWNGLPLEYTTDRGKSVWLYQVSEHGGIEPDPSWQRTRHIPGWVHSVLDEWPGSNLALGRDGQIALLVNGKRYQYLACVGTYDWGDDGDKNPNDDWCYYWRGRKLGTRDKHPFWRFPERF